MDSQLVSRVRAFGGSVRRGAVVAVGTGLALLPSIVLATPTVTVPEVDTTIMVSAGTKVFAAVALCVAIIIGLRLFKKA